MRFPLLLGNIRAAALLAHAVIFSISFLVTHDVNGDDEHPWFEFAPAEDPFTDGSAIDLRWLNEKAAGDGGPIAAKDGRFIHSSTGKPVRFWGVNGPPEDLRGDDLRRCARQLAKYGVNLVRVHTAVFGPDGEVDQEKVRHAIEIVEAMKREGIYTHFSIYFPLWFKPKPELAWLEGYNGSQHPFAALMFNPQFQKKHREWFTALLTTPHPTTKRSLVDDPAVFGVEIQNEDSLFFWTFDAKNIPPAQLQILERQFGDWLVKKYGSLDKTLIEWKGLKIDRDAPNEGRLGFRPIWNIFNERKPRDVDTAAFLLDTQTRFYRETRDHLRQIGFKGLVTASNWATASPERFGPLEKMSYMVGDFIDRHGYFECNHQGENAAWSIREQHTYSDRSALRFDANEPNKPKQFVHPVMDPQYGDKPSMISETTFTRPNRYRSEAPLYFAAYGALQESDCIIHFAFDGARWQVKPRFWMQQWTLATPAMQGQFPAAALLYRRGDVAPGDVVADVSLNTNEQLQLQGTPLPQDAAFDELRLKDVPKGIEVSAGQRLDPLLHYVGRTQVHFGSKPSGTKLVPLDRLIDRKAQTVTSTHGELKLNYGKGLLVINTSRAQGASGNLKAAGRIELPAMTIELTMDLAHVVAVSLDGKPLSDSQKILLQVNSEEQPTGFATESVDPHVKRITNIGHDPWQARRLSGQITFLWSDAARCEVTPLDHNGYSVPSAPQLSASKLELLPTTLYYLIRRR